MLQYLEELNGDRRSSAPSFWDARASLSAEQTRLLDDAALEVQNRDEQLALLDEQLSRAQATIDASRAEKSALAVDLQSVTEAAETQEEELRRANAAVEAEREAREELAAELAELAAALEERDESVEESTHAAERSAAALAAAQAEVASGRALLDAAKQDRTVTEEELHAVQVVYLRLRLVRLTKMEGLGCFPLQC